MVNSQKKFARTMNSAFSELKRDAWLRFFFHFDFKKTILKKIHKTNKTKGRTKFRKNIEKNEKKL